MRRMQLRVNTARKMACLACVAVLVLVACRTFTVYRIDRLTVHNKSGRISNGMRVAIQPDEEQAMVLVQLRYDVGAAHEPKDKKGLAHLVEHLAFRVGDELVERPVETAPTPGAGAEADPTRGDTPPPDGRDKATKKVRVVRYLVDENAYTTADETVYWKRVSPEHLDDVLADLAEQMGDFSPRIDAEVFATEKEVVHNERRHRYEGQPLDRAWLDLVERFYPPGHPYQGSVIGTHDTIDAITLEDVGRFLAAHYHPANATLAIVGPVEPQATLDLVMKHFGAKPQQAPSSLQAPAAEPRYHEELVVVPKAKETMITVAWPLGPRFSQDAVTIALLDDAISGWFHYRLVTNRSWAYWVHSGVVDSRIGSLYVVRALLREHRHQEDAKAKILEIADLMDSAVRPEDLGLARRRFIYRKLYDVEAQGSRADGLTEYFSYFGQPSGWMEEIERLEALDTTELRRRAGGILDKDRAFVLVHTPMAADHDEPGKGEPSGHAAYSRSAAEKSSGARLVHEERDRPEPLYDFTRDFGEYLAWGGAAASLWQRAEEVTLSNGVRCLVLRSGVVPVMSVTARFDGGALAEPVVERGVGHVLLDSMSLGSGTYQTDRYRMALQSAWDAKDESLVYTQRFPSVYADYAMRLFARLLSSPKLVRTSVVDDRDRLLQSMLGNAETDVDRLAWRAHLRARGMLHLAPLPTRASIQRISLGSVEEHHERMMYPENLVLAVVSDRPAAEVRALLEEHFGSWSRAGQPRIDLARLEGEQPAAAATTRAAIVPVAAAKQTKILVSYDAPGWRDWQGNLLARGVAKLLDQKAKRIREALGVTYGIDARVWALREHGSLYLSTKVERAATDAAVRQMRRVIDELRKRPVTDGELELVKRSLIMQHADSSRTSMVQSEHLAALLARGRGVDHDASVIEWLGGLTRAELQQALDRLLAQPGVLSVAGQEPDAACLPAEAAEVARFAPEELI